MLNTDYIYYVYSHVDPRSNELLYIGHGCRGRAWTHGSKLTCLRSQEHVSHLESIAQDGFVACDWVKILQQGITKKDACKIEQEQIRNLNPRYNLPQGLNLLKITPDILELSKTLKKKGYSYSRISTEVGLSSMTIYRALNGQTKNLKGDYFATN